MSHKRTCENNRRLRRLYNKTKYNYASGVCYDERKHRYKRFTSHSKDLKRLCKKITRHRLKYINWDTISQRSLYKKAFDYWWELL